MSLFGSLYDHPFYINLTRPFKILGRNLNPLKIQLLLWKYEDLGGRGIHPLVTLNLKKD